MQRLSFIDSSRGMAVLLAILSHAVLHFAAFVTFADGAVWLRSGLTRSATPTFLVLFGVMLELAYFRKTRDGGDIANARTRLFHRMLTCYLLYVAVTLAAVITYKLTWAQGGLAISFRGTGRFADILKIYAALFFIVALTYPMGHRWGAVFFLVLATLGWGIKSYLDGLGLPRFAPTQFLFGYGRGGGPTILPGMTLVAFGLWIGEAISGRRAAFWAVFGLALAGCVMGAGLQQYGGIGFIWRIILELRWLNHPYYYAYGCVVAAGSLAIFYALWRFWPAPSRYVSTAFVGRDTLFFYGFGNIALNMLPAYKGADPEIALMFIVAFMLGLTLVVICKAPIYASLDRITRGGMARGVTWLGRINHQCAQKLMRMARLFDRVFYSRS
ncbi:hypothetical protein KMP13_11680 [Epibacterium ulvae]|uniref:hypothetical protein n=1 Tax=Epibacterium ulvae TaxID=1156985 RepID=UPI001BFCBA75|nr:hypothetical protein [Epibacterium ulvae]MBT8154547.1 hypothetical protein [Epibacterium ulvae]